MRIPRSGYYTGACPRKIRGCCTPDSVKTVSLPCFDLVYYYSLLPSPRSESHPVTIANRALCYYTLSRPLTSSPLHLPTYLASNSSSRLRHKANTLTARLTIPTHPVCTPTLLRDLTIQHGSSRNWYRFSPIAMDFARRDSTGSHHSSCFVESCRNRKID